MARLEVLPRSGAAEKASPWSTRFGGRHAKHAGTGGAACATCKARADQHRDADGNDLGADAALEKYSASGDSSWVRPLPLGSGFSFDAWNADLALDADASLLVGLNFDGPVEFAGHTVTPRGQSDLLLVKYTAQGAPLWFQQVGAELADWTMGMPADPQRKVWLAYGSDTGLADECLELTIVKHAAPP